VDTIARADLRRARKTGREFLVITLARHSPQVTATFFNVKYLKHTLVEGTKVMLSGEVGFFRGTMQLTHPEFLILDPQTGRSGAGSKSLARKAEDASGGGGFDLSLFERDFYPIYKASARLQSWDIY